jgi:hypothetical protein
MKRLEFITARFLFVATFVLMSAAARAQDTQLFKGDNPPPGLVVYLDPMDTLTFAESTTHPGKLKWTIDSANITASRARNASSMSNEAGTIHEPTVYEWDPKTHSFWLGWRGMVIRETLKTDQTIDGLMCAVPTVKCLYQIKDAPPAFRAKMRQIVSAANSH